MDISYQIPRTGLVWVLTAVVMSLAPHALRLPVWISAIAALCILWRVLIFLGRVDYPGKTTRIALAIFILVASATQLRSVDVGLDAAASLLALGFIFKLVEMRSKRDIYVVLCLGFIMALVSLIYSQSMGTSMYVTLIVMVIIGGMISLNRRYGGVAAIVSTFGYAAKITAQSLPLMIVLFVVFPRVDPLWGVPVQSGDATTGVSDEMSPGDISQLGQSADLAFRVTFESGPPPLHENLYWRGLVLDEFDGTTWRRGGRSALANAATNANVELEYDNRIVTEGAPLDYNITLEPSYQRWIYGLHLAQPQSANIARGRNFELVNDALITQRLSYNLRSYRNNSTDLLLLDRIRRRALSLPPEGNPRSRQLAREVLQRSDSQRDYAFEVMALFQERFSYTLSPPRLGEERIDDFLFNTRAGYCEHFASAFAFMMRAGGIPARVVVGYQGGEFNRFENYMMVYQYNAHAWTEIWLEGEGWVRFDPTSIVSPERITLGVEAALGDDPNFLNESRFSLARFRDTSWMNTLRLRLDAVEYAWNRRVVSFSGDNQESLFESLFGESTPTKVVMVLAGASILALLLVGVTAIRFTPRRRKPAFDRLYTQFCHQLEREGLPRWRGEGPVDYCNRVSRALPAVEQEIRQITDVFLDLSYRELSATADGHRQLSKRMREAIIELQRKLTQRPASA